MQVTGKVHLIGGVEQVSDKFKKRLLVVKTDSQYNNLIPIEFKQDKTDLLNELSLGQDVTVHVNLEGREYNGKFYSSIGGWKVDAGMKPTNDDVPF